MGNEIDYVKLVQRAQKGNKKCLACLSKLATERMRTDVYRLTLDKDLTEEIVQESILEMLKILGQLKEANRFWPWLYRIALNKLFLHRRKNRNRPKVSMSAVGDEGNYHDGQEAIENAVAEELKEIVSIAMQKLKPRHRAVLTMRCYREMHYSEIAESLGCSEFAAQMLFYRAKKSLKKQLVRHGFGKGALLMALLTFGKMTAPSAAAAAEITMSVKALEVGVLASLASVVISKATIAFLVTAGAVTWGTVAVTTTPSQDVLPERTIVGVESSSDTLFSQENIEESECTFYYPPNGHGAVMIRFRSKPDNRFSYSQWLQNEQGNFYKDKNAVTLKNCRYWHRDLRVRRLPTDRRGLMDFLDRTDGPDTEFEPVRYKDDAFIVVMDYDSSEEITQTIFYRDISEEEYFRYNWLSGSGVVDLRDAMHKRGWTYFRIDGEIDGRRVNGSGRIPFVHSASHDYSPWIKVSLEEGDVIAPVGFSGLSRPWMGLHTIDTVRRDAARDGIRFETDLLSEPGKVQVTLFDGEDKLVYTIDMEDDIVEKIDFISGSVRRGELLFTYLQDVANAGSEFDDANAGDSRRMHGNGPGIKWLFGLMDNR